MEPLIFDTGPLSHFARIESLEVLRIIAGERRCIVPEAVVAELRRGVQRDSRIQAVLEAGWIEKREAPTDDELAAYATFASRLVSGGRNVGDAAVLALAKTLPGQAVIDDRIAHRIGTRAGVACTRTLRLLCEGIRSNLLTHDDVSDLADELIATDYHLPFGPGEFVKWAEENDLAASHPDESEL